MSDLEPPATLAHDVLNALTANIAVLDARGDIVAVNDAWIRFARANGAPDEQHYVGTNYLAVCEKTLRSIQDPLLEEMVRRLRAIVAGDDDEMTLEYPCHSPAEQRWFTLRATRLHGEQRAGAVVAHEDITVRKQMEQTLRETERTLRSVLEALPVGVWIMEAGGKIVHGNPAGQKIWGGARYVSPEQFGQYKGWWLATGRPIAADEWAAARAIRKGEVSIDEEIEIECFDGTRKLLLNSAIPLLDERGAIEGAIIVNQDITARKRDEAELRRAKEDGEAAGRELAEALGRERVLARVDDLTGATNRRHFFDLAAHEISVATRYHDALALIVFDIDDFKNINDSFGHQAGDDLLKRVSKIVGEHVRHADIFARYGGDEFVILLPHTRATEAAQVAERIRSDVSAQSVTISSGIAELLPGNDTLDALIHRADVALYQAKKGGRNRTAVFSGDAAQPAG